MHSWAPPSVCCVCVWLETDEIPGMIHTSLYLMYRSATGLPSSLIVSFAVLGPPSSYVCFSREFKFLIKSWPVGNSQVRSWAKLLVLIRRKAPPLTDALARDLSHNTIIFHSAIR